MAKPVSEEELQLRKRARRRLIGAIALVAVVAVVLPMVFDTDPKPTSHEINIRIPSPDEKGFVSKVVPMPAPAKSAAESKPEPRPAAQDAAPAAALTPEPSKEAAPAEKPAPKPASAKSAAKAPDKTETTAMPKAGTFFIQVTALADTEKALRVQRQIIDAGLLSYTQVVAAGKGTVTRVRAGPFATRDEAEKAREKLKSVGLEGKVAEIKRP